MEFEITYYKDKDGKSPIEEFLIGLVKTNQTLFSQSQKNIEKLKFRQYHQEPLSKHLEPDLWELRIKAGSNLLRIIYTFKKGQIIIFLHIFVKKQQKTPIKELEIAKKRLKEIIDKGESNEES